MPRKNITAVVRAFKAGHRHTEKTCSTDGTKVYSYNLPIAARGPDGTVYIRKTWSTHTTNGQINAVKREFPDATIVHAILPDGEIMPLEPDMGRG